MRKEKRSREKMSTDFKLVLTGAGLLMFLVGFMFFGITNFFGNVVKPEAEQAQTLDDIAEATEIGDESVSLNWNQEEVVSTMHKMIHQKVDADDKWGAVQMTNDRLDVLISLVKDSKFPNRGKLLAMLSTWRSGDFSYAWKDHNALWEMQGGTVGRAKGNATEEEEKQFIEDHFE